MGGGGEEKGGREGNEVVTLQLWTTDAVYFEVGQGHCTSDFPEVFPFPKQKSTR